MRQNALILGLLALLAAGMTEATETEIGLRDVTVIHDGRGAARILFRTGALPISDRLVVDRAVLAVPWSGAAEERSLELRVCPVTTSWGGWETDFDRELYARAEADLRRGPGMLSFDITMALRAIAEHGLTADGFVLIPGESRLGLTSEEVSRLASLAGASLRVTTTALPSGRPPAAWLARRGLD